MNQTTQSNTARTGAMATVGGGSRFGDQTNAMKHTIPITSTTTASVLDMNCSDDDKYNNKNGDNNNNMIQFEMENDQDDEGEDEEDKFARIRQQRHQQQQQEQEVPPIRQLNTNNYESNGVSAISLALSQLDDDTERNMEDNTENDATENFDDDDDDIRENSMVLLPNSIRVVSQQPQPMPSSSSSSISNHRQSLIRSRSKLLNCTKHQHKSELHVLSEEESFHFSEANMNADDTANANTTTNTTTTNTNTMNTNTATTNSAIVSTANNNDKDDDDDDEDSVDVLLKTTSLSTHIQNTTMLLLNDKPSNNTNTETDHSRRASIRRSITKVLQLPQQIPWIAKRNTNVSNHSHSHNMEESYNSFGDFHNSHFDDDFFNNNDKNANKKENDLEETCPQRTVRLCFLFLLVLYGFFYSVGSYLILLHTTTTTTNDIEEPLSVTNPYNLGIQQQKQIESNLITSFDTVQSIANDIISNHVDRMNGNMSWPFVTIDQYEYKIQQMNHRRRSNDNIDSNHNNTLYGMDKTNNDITNNSSNVVTASNVDDTDELVITIFLPIVSAAKRKDWESYSSKQFPIWMNDSQSMLQAFNQQDSSKNREKTMTIRTEGNRALLLVNSSSLFVPRTTAIWNNTSNSTTAFHFLDDNYFYDNNDDTDYRGSGYNISSIGNIDSQNAGPYLPIWQTSPYNIFNESMYNMNLLSGSSNATSDNERCNENCSSCRLTQALWTVLNTQQTVVDTFPSTSTMPTSTNITDNSSCNDTNYANKNDKVDWFIEEIIRVYRETYHHNTSSSLAPDEFHLSVSLQPILDNKTSNITAILMVIQDWKDILLRNSNNNHELNYEHPMSSKREEDTIGHVVIPLSPHGDMITYQISTNDRVNVSGDEGYEDYDDPDFDTMKHTFDLNSDGKFYSDYGITGLYFYPMNYATDVDEIDDNVVSSQYSAIYFSGVSILFLICMGLFGFYNIVTRRRHTITCNHALQSSALVASIFPEQVHERLLKNNGLVPDAEKSSLGLSSRLLGRSSHGMNHSLRLNLGDEPIQEPPKLRLKSLLRTPSPLSPDLDQDDKPIADYFPDCTIMFADIVGFTAWSSTRDPTQVFTLLQNVFHEFDKAAKKRGVFKVETIGDTYVAVAGLPQPNKDHALVMSGFAIECRKLMKDVTRSLEGLLGPNTRDLRARFGLHSGPVIAGVMKGTKARFQLFGDTMNTASRMESTGLPDFVQVSESTASLLESAGRGDWLCERDGMVTVKGKGNMKTYMLIAKHSKTRGRIKMITDDNSISACNKIAEIDPEPTTVSISNRSINGSTSPAPREGDSWGDDYCRTSFNTVASGSVVERDQDDLHDRLVTWNVNLLLDLLKKVIARRPAETKTLGSNAGVVTLEDQELFLSENVQKGKSVVDDVTEVIELPAFDPKLFVDAIDPDSVVIKGSVVKQLREYVTIIASSYRNNPFHNYEHACHVQMSMMKLLQRVTTPEQISYEGQKEVVASDAHDYTFGIASDPLTQFAVVFCSLIHDVDHAGVNNAQLIKENAYIASLYQGKSVAEQNSIDISWGLLMGPEFNDLRECIYTNRSEFIRFRHLVVNVVLATDIFDKELSALRKKRWNEAFYELPKTDSFADHSNRKATIVIEHLIQASDVAHTMQHWNVYRKWNESLFHEMYLAYQSGRADSDPSSGWYKGELWFFDNYIIPLAKKLSDCSVFGVSSEECLNYAIENRGLWEAEGENIVREMLKSDFCKNLRESNSIVC